MKKFNGVDDREIIRLWLKGDLDAEQELVFRYRRFSMALAKEVITDFKDVSAADYEDLVSIGLFSLFLIIKKFDFSGAFFPYWKKVATHRMMDEIKANSISYNLKEMLSGRGAAVHYVDEKAAFFSAGVMYEKDALRQDLLLMLENPGLKVSKSDAQMFMLYVDGYEIKQIALIFDCSYSKASRSIRITKAKLKDILFNS